VLRAITLVPIVLNVIGDGQPDVHDPHANNTFLDTRGLPSAATGARARYILARLAVLSEAFGTQLEVADGQARIRLADPP
jgi:hypothetical protein